jgi:prevent-host-death family protein
MDSIPVRELNQHTSAVLARVANGESLEITVSGHPPAARLVPIDDNTSIRAELIRRGRLIPAGNPVPPALPPGDPDLLTAAAEIGLPTAAPGAG